MDHSGWLRLQDKSAENHRVSTNGDGQAMVLRISGKVLMEGHGTKFGRKKEAAIAALLSQRSIDEAARAIEVAPNTLLRWMKEPDFRVAYPGSPPLSLLPIHRQVAAGHGRSGFNTAQSHGRSHHAGRNKSARGP